MSGQETDEILDHDYDGIQEYDNPLPRWWVWLFYLTIVFAVIYVPYYHFGPGLSQEEELAREMEAAAAVLAKRPKVEVTGDALAAAQKDPAKIAEGKEVYDKLCFACHAAGGAGLVGPNLADEHWIHGGSMANIVRVVTEGVPDKGMIAWKDQLKPDQIIAVSAYIKSLKGTSPANPKAPEGELYTGD